MARRPDQNEQAVKAVKQRKGRQKQELLSSERQSEGVLKIPSPSLCFFYLFFFKPLFDIYSVLSLFPLLCSCVFCLISLFCVCFIGGDYTVVV